MKIHKWVCSDPSLIPEEERQAVLELQDPEHASDFPQGKSLGIYYDSQKDEFRFREPHSPPEKVWTRHNALQYFMGIFDPKGLILPVLMLSRFLYHDTWYGSSDWHTTLDPKLQKGWSQWASGLVDLPMFRFPRWLALEHLSKSHHGLHVFVDASGDAFGAVAYLVSSRGSVL